MRKLAILGVLVLVAITFAMLTPANAAVISNEKIPVEGLLWSDCANEFIDLQGTAHTVISSTDDGAGGTHFDMHIIIIVTGVGETSGVKYQGMAVENMSGNVRAGSFPAVFTDAWTIRGSAPQPNNTQVIKGLTHVTVNANGDVTVVIDNLSSGCKR